MVANNGFPSATTVGLGLFDGASSSGLVVGTYFEDPVARFALRGGVVSQNETIPMVGGLAVYALLAAISSTGPVQSLGPSLGRATGLSTSFPLAGFSVFNQAYNMVIDPSNPVQNSGSGQMLNYMPLGSRARVSLACDPSLISLRNGPNAGNLVSYDFTAQEVIPYGAAYSQATISNAVWASTAGGQITFTVGTDLTADLAQGDDIEVSSVVNTGGASTSAFNGFWTIVSINSTTIVVTAPAASSIGTYASGGHVNAGGGAIPGVTVLDVSVGNSMVPVYSASLGTWSWNYSGAAITLLI